jgi:outer membrane protein assembly factor BamB
MKENLIILFLVFMSLCVNAQTPSSWPNYRGNNVLNGISHSTLQSPLKLAWSFKTGDEIKSSPVISNGLIFIGSMDGFLYALDFNGKVRWKFKAESSIESSPIVFRKTVIFSSSSGLVYALDETSGKQKWKYRTEGQIMGSANWLSDGNGIQILIPSYDFCLYSLKFETGKLNWKCQTENYLNGAAATDNKKIVIGGCDAFLHIIRASDGKSLAKIEIGTYVAESAAISGNLAFVGDYDGGFTCVDLVTNKKKWKFTSPKASPFLSSPAINTTHAFIGSHDKNVYCFEKETGKISWTYKSFGKIESSPVLLRDKLVICSNDGFIHFIDIKKGRKLYSYDLGVAMKSTPAIINNWLVVAGKDGRVYALRGKM